MPDLDKLINRHDQVVLAIYRDYIAKLRDIVKISIILNQLMHLRWFGGPFF